MRSKESFTKELQEMLSRLNELANNYDKKETQVLDELDDIVKRYDETVDHLYHFEEHLYSGDKNLDYFAKKAEECHQAHKLRERIAKKMEDLRREITGYDERAIMDMMYPNEDIDSEDFEDGFDMEDFYED